MQGRGGGGAAGAAGCAAWPALSRRCSEVAGRAAGSEGRAQGLPASLAAGGTSVCSARPRSPAGPAEAVGAPSALRRGGLRAGGSLQSLHAPLRAHGHGKRRGGLREGRAALATRAEPAWPRAATSSALQPRFPRHGAPRGASSKDTFYPRSPDRFLEFSNAAQATVLRAGAWGPLLASCYLGGGGCALACGTEELQSRALCPLKQQRPMCPLTSVQASVEGGHGWLPGPSGQPLPGSTGRTPVPESFERVNVWRRLVVTRRELLYRGSGGGCGFRPAPDCACGVSRRTSAARACCPTATLRTAPREAGLRALLRLQFQFRSRCCYKFSSSLGLARFA